MKISPLPALVLVVSALMGCEEASAPEGQAGDLTVAAYIDNDASGSLTTGDIPLANFEVALFRGSQEITTARTAADGRVTFSDLPPGSYRVEAVGPVPTGATLTSNPSPSAVIDFRGRAVSVDFRYAMFPGIITGRVFRDENGNGTFEQGVDVPGPGLWVFLRADTGAAGAKLDSVRTDSLGAYRFGLVAPGDYFLEFEQLGAINYGASGSTRPVTVVGAATASLNVLFTGSIFVTIRQARATAVDTTVAVIGDITAPPGLFTSGTGGVNSEIWVQDTTGGIAAFPVPTADSATLRLGTRIEVVGPITLFSGQRQIGRAGAAPTIRVRTGGSAVAPKANTAAQARALTDEGRLVTVSGLRVDSVPAGTGGAFTVRTVSATNDTLQIRVAGTATGLTRSSFILGERYNITGILTQFNGTAQVKPRFAADVAQIVVTPVARIIINEIMANPSAPGDSGEYIEIYNWGTAPADLQNWKLFGNSLGDTARITTSLIVPAGGYVLLGNNPNTARNGGLVLDYAYTVFNMNNTGDRIVLKDAAGATVDSVAYTTAPPTNASRGVRDASADNTDVGGANWQTSTTPYNAVDLGTPKAQNDGYIAPTQPAPFVRGGRIVGPMSSKQR
jgi:hypothetical protein